MLARARGDLELPSRPTRLLMMSTWRKNVHATYLVHVVVANRHWYSCPSRTCSRLRRRYAQRAESRESLTRRICRAFLQSFASASCKQFKLRKIRVVTVWSIQGEIHDHKHVKATKNARGWATTEMQEPDAQRLTHCTRQQPITTVRTGGLGKPLTCSVPQ